jgi:hypothetical protein
VTSAGSHIPLSAAAAVRVTGSGPITVDLVAFIQPWSGGDGVTGYNINGTLLATTVPLGWNGGTTLE